MFVQSLRCRLCGKTAPVEPLYVCDDCFGPLEAVYDYAAIRGALTREAIERGPRSIWRYAPLLPADNAQIVTLQEGFTPLLPAPRLGKRLGLRNLFIKNDAVNPTYSFKDRVVAVAVSRARGFGFDTVSCASTGNLGCAVAAYGAVAGMRACIFIPSDLEASKITGITVYGPTLVAVTGSYDDVNRLCTEISYSHRWAFVNINLRPYYSEGSKTLAYEVAEQLDWKAPDAVVIPMASGSLLTKIHKGFKEFAELGLIPKPATKVFGAQPDGCSPIATAFRNGLDQCAPVRPKTIAKSLAIGNPADGPFALRVMRETGGSADSVNDSEIVESMRLLASEEGIFTETAGGVTVGVLKKLAASGRIRPDDLTVAYITGNGYKTQEAVASAVNPIRIGARLEDFQKAFGAASAPAQAPVIAAG